MDHLVHRPPRRWSGLPPPSPRGTACPPRRPARPLVDHPCSATVGVKTRSPVVPSGLEPRGRGATARDRRRRRRARRAGRRPGSRQVPVGEGAAAPPDLRVDLVEQRIDPGSPWTGHVCGHYRRAPRVADEPARMHVARSPREDRDSRVPRRGGRRLPHDDRRGVVLQGPHAGGLAAHVLLVGHHVEDDVRLGGEHDCCLDLHGGIVPRASTCGPDGDARGAAAVVSTDMSGPRATGVDALLDEVDAQVTRARGHGLVLAHRYWRDSPVTTCAPGAPTTSPVSCCRTSTSRARGPTGPPGCGSSPPPWPSTGGRRGTRLCRSSWRTCRSSWTRWWQP